MRRCRTCGQELPLGVTPRELEVLTQLAHGLTTRQIAARLSMAPKTAESHLQHLFRRAGVPNRTALLAWAFRQGLVALPAKEEEP